MGRLYSGNLNEYRDAVARLEEDHDVYAAQVETLCYFDESIRSNVIEHVVEVNTRSGVTLTRKVFRRKDDDVLYAEMTSWLRKVHSDLRWWH